jgi:hypothetical protein
MNRSDHRGRASFMADLKKFKNTNILLVTASHQDSIYHTSLTYISYSASRLAHQSTLYSNVKFLIIEEDNKTGIMEKSFSALFSALLHIQYYINS